MEITISKGDLTHTEQYTASIRDISERQKIEDQLYQEKEKALVNHEKMTTYGKGAGM